jgi:hypothetical protein
VVAAVVARVVDVDPLLLPTVLVLTSCAIMVLAVVDVWRRR